MKKKSLLLAVAGIMLATANAPAAQAHEVSGVGNSKLSSPSVSVSKALTDGRYNFRYFEVEASEAGEYYTEFWLLPARLSDKSYSTFNVYVNDSYAGDIKPTAGNLVGSVRCGRTSAEVPASELNMTQPGLYVISVKTVSGITSRKISVK